MGPDLFDYKLVDRLEFEQQMKDRRLEFEQQTRDRRLEFEQHTKDRRLEFEQQTEDLYHREARKHSPVGSIVGVNAGSIVRGRRMGPN